jgi:hypothetical protein
MNANRRAAAEQDRKTYREVTAFEKSLEAAGKGAATFTRKIIDIARRDVNSSFDLATSLTGAKGLYDTVKLRAVSWRKQVDALTAQAEEVRALSAEPAAPAAAAPKTGAGVSQ